MVQLLNYHFVTTSDTVANEDKKQKLADFVEIISGKFKNAKSYYNGTITNLNYHIYIQPVRVHNIPTLPVSCLIIIDKYSLSK